MSKLYLILITTVLFPFSLQAYAAAAPSRAHFLVKHNDRPTNLLEKEVCEVVADAIVLHPEAVIGAEEITGKNKKGVDVTVESPISGLRECHKQECLFTQNHPSRLRKQMAEKLQSTSLEIGASEYKFVYVRYGVDGLFSVLQDLIHLMQYEGPHHPATQIRIVLIDEKYASYCTQMTNWKEKHKQQKKKFPFLHTSCMSEPWRNQFERKGFSELHDQLVQLMDVVYSFCFHASLMGNRFAELYVCSTISDYTGLIDRDEPKNSSGRPTTRGKSRWRAQILVIDTHVHDEMEQTQPDDLKSLLNNIGSYGNVPFLGLTNTVDNESAKYVLRTFTRGANQFEGIQLNTSEFQTRSGDGELVWEELEPA